MTATPAADGASLKDLLSEVTGEVSLLLRKEVELAKAEISQTVSQATKAGVMFAVAGVTGLLAVLLLSFAAAWGLAEVIPEGLAFLAVAGFYLLLAGLFFLRGRKQVARLSPAPERTLTTVKDNVQVAKTALSRGAGGSLRQEQPGRQR